MAKINIDKQVMANVEKFAKEVRKDNDVDAVLIFGSYAKGTQDENSDIDVAIVLKKIENRFDEMGRLYNYTWNTDTRIEPHPINTDDYLNGNSFLAHEIKQHGIQIYAA